VAARSKPPSPETPNLHVGLGDRLAEARAAAGLSFQKLADASGVGNSQIFSIEKGMPAGVAIIEKLAHALGISPAWLAYGIGPMVPEEQPSTTPAKTTKRKTVGPKKS
jgi:transcriptional regulator with XRE-family HTH domain